MGNCALKIPHDKLYRPTQKYPISHKKQNSAVNLKDESSDSIEIENVNNSTLRDTVKQTQPISDVDLSANNKNSANISSANSEIYPQITVSLKPISNSQPIDEHTNINDDTVHMQQQNAVSAAAALESNCNHQENHTQPILAKVIDNISKEKIDCQSNTLCQCFVRMLEAVKYYESIKSEIDKNEYKEKLVEFYTEHYKYLLDDYIHIITEHDDNPSIKCNIQNCKHILRCYRDRENDSTQHDDLDFIFYRDVIDQIHCNMFHLYDTGMRLCKDGKQPNEEIKGLNKDKYNIISKCQQNTLLDGLYMDMLCKRIPLKNVQNLFSKLQDEEYDSDALKYDFYNDVSQSNVAACTHHFIIQRYLRLSFLYKSSFSTGYTFYYWDHYQKSIKNYRFFANQHDHSGFQENELYVSTKYKDIKQEILQNSQRSLSVYAFDILMNKAQKYATTDKVKALVSDCPHDLFYEIDDDTPISLSHLLSVILYTDNTDLCTSFSSTFRKKFSYEPVSSIKMRNCEYAHWSKLLREAVQVFGRKGYEGDIENKKDQKWNEENNRVKGPFFCGMSVELVCPEFNIKLCAPTSTSKQCEVADRYAATNGVVLTLDNYGYLNCEHLRSFCCAWISCYNMEDEYLFIGGHMTIKIVSVTRVSTLENFYDFFEPLFYFDCMVKGNYFEDDFEIEHQESKYEIILNFIQHQLKTHDMSKCKCHPYMTKTFDCFVNHKTQIILQLEVLNKQLNIFKHVLINDDDLLKPIIFDLFPNCKHIIIYATDTFGEKQYKFDLCSLFSLIKSNESVIKLNGIKITVIGKWEYFEEKQCSWIQDSFIESIKSKVCDNTLNVKLTENMVYYDAEDSRKEDHLTICYTI